MHTMSNGPFSGITEKGLCIYTILDRADLVTEMREVKHYYSQGVLARVGIES